MAAETQLTPMMAQYRRIKSDLPRDALLLFQLGDCWAGRGLRHLCALEEARDNGHWAQLWTRT